MLLLGCNDTGPLGTTDAGAAADATPDACESEGPNPPAICDAESTHESRCALAAGFTFAWEGGDFFRVDKYGVEPPASIHITRTFLFDAQNPDETCTTTILLCSRDARDVTTADVTHALAHPDVTAAFAPGLPVYGRDLRPVDGNILVIRRADGTALGLGRPCSPSSGSDCVRALQPGMEALASLLARVREQTLRSVACAALAP